MVFHWSLSDSKSPQVSRTLLSILAVLNNAVVWMASTRLLTSMSSRTHLRILAVVIIIIMIIIIIIIILRVFHTSVSRWYPSEVWVIASLLESPGLLSVFWTILIKTEFGWSPLFLLLLLLLLLFTWNYITVGK